jgi:hypothetical protein
MIKVKIDKVKENSSNPRFIKDHKFRKLVKSIKDFPEMLEKRPIVVDEDYVVLGGNMRLKACKEAGLTEVSIDIAKGWTDEQKQEFIIKDNSSFGEWDWDTLANEWDTEKLDEWGLDLPKLLEFKDEDDIYSKKINAPLYEPREVKPSINDLFDSSKYEKLLEEIDKSNLEDTEKRFLKLAATRHIIFYFDKIADYYSHSEKDTKELMENNALVIIDYDKAIRNGYVELQQSVYEQYVEDYG